MCVCVCVCVCLFPSYGLWMVYISCLACSSSILGLREKNFVGTCSSSFLGLRGKLLVGTCSSSFLGLRKIFVGACSLSFSGLRNDLHPFMDDVRIFKTIYILLRNFILFFFFGGDVHPFKESYRLLFFVDDVHHLKESYHLFFMWMMYIHLRNLIVSTW